MYRQDNNDADSKHTGVQKYVSYPLRTNGWFYLWAAASSSV